ncbi:MAG: hypothetical protein KKF12_08720 [Proteobacteria bacterium]|nr:hypothetical protein [Desulfobacula sp.]MBU4130889.1 hypothetical protein [Pseudomonadota bacterium]
MTTIPGHSQMLQQSGIAQEVSNQGHTLKPSPDQAIAAQQALKIIQGSTVQGAEESERLKKQKDKKASKQAADKRKRKAINQEEELALEPDAPGRLLDTRV